jgi:hypothetical protein
MIVEVDSFGWLLDQLLVLKLIFEEEQYVEIEAFLKAFIIFRKLLTRFYLQSVFSRAVLWIILMRLKFSWLLMKLYGIFVVLANSL